MPEITPATTSVFTANLAAQARTVVNIGGARSSKSHSLAQLMIMKLVNEPGAQIGITRKTMPALRMTAMRLVLRLLKEYRVYPLGRHSRTEDYFEYNGGRIQFFSLDDPEKIKSSEFNYLWLEEASEFTREDYTTLLTRLSARSADGAKNRMYLTLNPTDSTGWIRTKLLSEPDTQVIHSTYRDNRFLSSGYTQILENLRATDENAYRVYALGQWGRTQGLIYTHYTQCDALPENYDDRFFGLDFGYNNPTALVEVRTKDTCLYIRELIYETGLTNTDLKEKLLAFDLSGLALYADSAEPDRIAELNEAGLTVYPADKAVKNGIGLLQSSKLFVTKSSPNLLKELASYRWKALPSGEMTDEPAKFNDHALDALRYAAYTHTKSGGDPALTIF